MAFKMELWSSHEVVRLLEGFCETLWVDSDVSVGFDMDLTSS